MLLAHRFALGFEMSFISTLHVILALHWGFITCRLCYTQPFV